MTTAKAKAKSIPAPTRHRFTVEEYDRMGKAGIFKDDDRVELIEGDIIEMAPIDWPHMNSVNEQTEIFVKALSGRAIVSVQNGFIAALHSAPQPDIALLRPEVRIKKAVPRPEDVLLIVEVANTTLSYDRRIKLPLYARAGIPEVWIANVSRDRLLVYRDPGPDGYRTELTLRGDETVSPLAFPDLVFTARQILGQ